MISRRPVSCTAWAITTHLRAHAPAVADLLDLGVEEQIRVAALQRPLAERLDLLVQQPAQIRLTSTSADPQPEALDELIDAARRHAADIGLLDHATSACSERLRGCRKLGK